MALSRANEPVACEKCGSIFFYSLDCQLFTGGSYGMRPISQAPQKLFICICGSPFVPTNVRQGVQTGSEREMFLASFDAAMDYQAATSPDAIAQGTASVSEVEHLRHKLAELSELVAALTGSDPIELDNGDSVSDETDVNGEEESPNDPPPAIPVVPDVAPRSGRPVERPMGTDPDVKEMDREDRRPAGRKGGARERLARQGV
jgi:hypothetical protein